MVPPVVLIDVWKRDSATLDTRRLGGAFALVSTNVNPLREHADLHNRSTHTTVGHRPPTWRTLELAKPRRQLTQVGVVRVDKEEVTVERPAFCSSSWKSYRSGKFDCTCDRRPACCQVIPTDAKSGGKIDVAGLKND
ncbi:unnamed protein product [Mesocestoides corti]|uniref:Uncharacterized protein n=1 Tax=Mesocestoides corti TaxID=53468 RepID=A0A0R3U4L1_MESCO|nr:unnamed protein product [Mesocestoides corti]